MTLDLHTYFRSSAAYRVRIAMNLKGLEARPHYVHLAKGEQSQPAYKALNPQGLVPLLEDDGARIGQSLAIIEYLEETHPERPLLPADPVARAHVRELSLAISCDVHPLNNLRVLKYLTGELGLGEEAKLKWIHHWITAGFTALEAQLAANRGAGNGPFCVGATPTLADCCLVPQWFSGQRFNVDLAPFPTLAKIVQACDALEAFQAAHPGRQPDAE